MLQRLAAALCLLLVASAAQADPQSTYQWMLTNQIVASAQTQNGVGTVVIGPDFFDGDFNSQQTLCGTLLKYLQTLDSTVQQFTLFDSQGNTVGTYSSGVLTLGQ